LKNKNSFFLFRELASTGKDLTDVVLRELAKREEANRSGKMTVKSRFKIKSFAISFFFKYFFHLQVNHIHTRQKQQRPRGFRLHRLCSSTKNRRL